MNFKQALRRNLDLTTFLVDCSVINSLSITCVHDFMMGRIALVGFLADTSDYLAPYSNYMAPYSDCMAPYSNCIAPYSSYMAPYSNCMAPYSHYMAPYNHCVEAGGGLPYPVTIHIILSNFHQTGGNKGSLICLSQNNWIVLTCYRHQAQTSRC